MKVMIWIAALLPLACGEAERGAVDPVEVDPATSPTRPADTTTPGAGSGGALWVEDADGQIAGVLVRRGTDDHIVDRVIYDIITVFHPDSGLFYEVTMSDGVVRRPNDVFFRDYGCGEPIGIAAGGCAECRSAYGVGILHGGSWYRMRGGVLFEQMGPGSSLGSGLQVQCVAHGTSNARAFPLDAVAGAAPPTSLRPPLEVVFR